MEPVKLGRVSGHHIGVSVDCSKREDSIGRRDNKSSVMGIRESP